MPKELNREEYLIVICYTLIVFTLITEPFIYQIINKEQIRMYAMILFFIGAIILSKILNKKEVKNKNELQIHKQNVMSTTKRRNKNK